MSDGWTAGELGNAVVRQFFQRKVLAIPNCTWPGSECDLLVVAKCLRLIDVEIKITRADLKADFGKDKWWRFLDYRKDVDGRWKPHREPRRWPHQIWKHYYVMPRTVFKTELLDAMPAVSGVVVADRTRHGHVVLEALRRARPCGDAKPIDGDAAIDIARLAGLRMWEALAERDKRMRPLA